MFGEIRAGGNVREEGEVRRGSKRERMGAGVEKRGQKRAE